MKLMFSALMIQILLWSTPLYAAEDVYPDFASIPTVFKGPFIAMNDYNRQLCGIEFFLQSAMGTMRTYGGDEQLLTPQKNEEIQKTQNERLMFEYRGKILALDFDLDGKITTEELKRGYKISNHGLPEKEVVNQQLENYDANKDGTIVMDEIKDALPKIVKRAPYKETDFTDLLALSTHPDGRISAAELEALARKAFRTMDKDNNGFIGTDELRDVKKAVELDQELQKGFTVSHTGVPGTE